MLWTLILELTVFLAISLFRPEWLKGVASFLSLTSDAVIAARNVFRGTPQQIAMPAVSQNPVVDEVVEALVSQGAKRRKAQDAVTRAMQQSGPQLSFEDLWRAASLEWRKAA